MLPDKECITNVVVGQKPDFWKCNILQVDILLYSRVTTLTDLNFEDILIKCGRVKQIDNFSREIF